MTTCVNCSQLTDEPRHDDTGNAYCEDCACQIRKDAPESFLGEWA